MSGPLRIAVLGSTGSIGRQTLDVAAHFPERVRVVALAAHENVALLAEQARAFGVGALAIANPVHAENLAALAPGTGVGAGPDAVAALAASEDVDLVVNALVGSAGLRTSITALTARKVLALANKESLVVGGSLVTSLVTRPGMLIPIDSEHSAIFQCLVGENAGEVARIWLTASGGPFRGRSADGLATVTREEALAHPRWTMGPKVTIDSATLMNKGLEAIEAYHLFGIGFDSIRIVVHPQSCVHSMVEFTDGSVKAHLGATDMRIPIQYALSYPNRWDAPVPPVDFAAIGRLDFEEPDYAAFPCCALALEAGRTGGTMPAAMNAANEVAVAAFLGGTAGFMDIPRVVSAVMDSHVREDLESVEQVESVDRISRELAGQLL